MILAKLGAEVGPGDNPIDQSRGAGNSGMEALGKFLADGLLNHTRTGKADERRGSARMTSPSMAKLAVTPPVVGRSAR